MLSRREFMKLGSGAAVAFALSRNRLYRAFASPAAAGLSDPALQPKFIEYVPNALDPGFRFTSSTGKYKVAVGQTVQETGLVDGVGNRLPTTVWGYGSPAMGYTWPGRTFEVQSYSPIEVTWENRLIGSSPGAYLPHLLPVDTSLHWCYSLHGYTDYTIKKNGVPIVTHLHGGHSDSPFDGNPEYFFSPGWVVRGPRWVDKKFVYHNDQPAGNLWYHDHALGITRLNVYAGLAGFYFIRDEFDTGKANNPSGLPAGPYELAYAIQDRMFKSNGALFYPAFPGDPFYDDFITGEGAILPPDIFPGGGPTALAEFFGDHMVVNGKIWPKTDVEPRNYRMHLLNGTDSRFMVIRFREVPLGATDLSMAGDPIPFHVIGSDQGLAAKATEVDELLSEPGSRWDIVFDFSQITEGSRIIMENIGGDAPFGGDYGDDLAPEDLFPDRQTDRIMAFDVVLPLNGAYPDIFDHSSWSGPYVSDPGTKDLPVRKVALFEGMDEFGRLQPLLGVAEPTVDAAGFTVNGTLAWHQPTTENPALGSTEVWEIYNATGDAHPIHLHLVHFEILDRQQYRAKVIEQPVMQHNGTYGTGFRLEDIKKFGRVTAAPAVEKAPKDMVTALPGEVTRIKATFDKPGRYVWHCHILSHEDHEMMRVLHVGPGA